MGPQEWTAGSVVGKMGHKRMVKLISILGAGYADKNSRASHRKMKGLVRGTIHRQCGVSQKVGEVPGSVGCLVFMGWVIS